MCKSDVGVGAVRRACSRALGGDGVSGGVGHDLGESGGGLRRRMACFALLGPSRASESWSLI